MYDGSCLPYLPGMIGDLDTLEECRQDQIQSSRLERIYSKIMFLYFSTKTFAVTSH